MTSTALGFDYGTQKIGIAVGQTVTSTASALRVIPARDGIPDWRVIEKIIQEWKPDILVVGLPLNMDGTESDISKRARTFANRLTGRFSVPSVMVDERLSTREARAQAEQSEQVDAIAARIILESWLAAQ